MHTPDDIRRSFEAVGEYYAAALFELPDATPFVRYSRAIRRWLERQPMPAYCGEPLYPCGQMSGELQVQYHYSFTVAWMRTDNMAPEAEQALRQELDKSSSPVPPEHCIGGNMYTHSHPNFGRIVHEGLDSYMARIERMHDDDMRRGLTDVVEGIRCFHARALALLEGEPDAAQLRDALLQVPFKPARTLYEALVCWNFIYYMDGCDNIGRIDADLIDLYRGEDMTGVLRCLFDNVNINNGWSGALGPDYNPLTLQCLRAIKGMRRPSIELRVTDGMPDEVWAAAQEAVYAGGGQPAFYNEEAYQTALAELFPEIPAEDRIRFCGGGCTETMLTGISNVGSLDAGINVALIFERVMRESLPGAADFEAFYAAFMAEYRREIARVCDAVSESQQLRARYRPQPMRSLLMDDCIDRERDFNNGGARYNWSVINLAGMINVLDSLLVIRQLVFDDRLMDGAELLTRMDAGDDFRRHHGIQRHGTDSDAANAMAGRLTADLCAAFDEHRPWHGGRFLPSSIQFITYTDAGKGVGATPDGRCAGAPLCDSIGAIHGNDSEGVTALLNSAAALCQRGMAGTPVMNLSLNPQHLSGNLKALVQTYFQSGGMQLQVTCVSREDMIDAQQHPERHQNLIVRVGGYADYFNALSSELQQAVIERTAHEA